MTQLPGKAGGGGGWRPQQCRVSREAVVGSREDRGEKHIVVSQEDQGEKHILGGDSRKVPDSLPSSSKLPGQDSPSSREVHCIRMDGREEEGDEVEQGEAQEKQVIASGRDEGGGTGEAGGKHRRCSTRAEGPRGATRRAKSFSRVPCRARAQKEHKLLEHDPHLSTIREESADSRPNSRVKRLAEHGERLLGDSSEEKEPVRCYRVFGGTGKTSTEQGRRLRADVRTFMTTYHAGGFVGVNRVQEVKKEQRGEEQVLGDPEWGEGPMGRELTTRDEVQVCTAFSQLALYCPVEIKGTKAYGLVDCGAGINLANSRFIAKLVSDFGSDGIEVVRDRLVVRVADGNNWVLNRRARIQYLVGGCHFRQTFWLSPDLKEDLLLGMPALRGQEVSLHIGSRAGTDVLQLRGNGTEVPLTSFPNGVQTGDVPLKAVETFTIARGTGRWVEVGVGRALGIFWPGDKELTGLVSPTSVQGYSCHPMPSANRILKHRTIVFLKNHTNRDQQVFAGEEVARFQPTLLETEKDERGREYLYEGLGGSLHPKVFEISSLRESGKHFCGGRVPERAPVAVRERAVDDNMVHERVWLIATDDHARRGDRAQGGVRSGGNPKKEGSLCEGVQEVGGIQELEEAMDAKVALNSGGGEYTWREAVINLDLSEEDKELVRNLLRKYPQFFKSGQQHYPNPKLPEWTKLHIQLKGTAAPWCTRSYPLSEYKRQIMRDIVGKQLRQGMISHSSSCYASPSFLVAKSSGGTGAAGHRLIVDLRLCNAQIEKSSWPIPRISEILDKLHGCKWFSSIDLADGFHQIGVSEESRKYTAFITEDGLYEYQTVPMGLSISPNHFQYVMDRILGGMGMALDNEGKASETEGEEVQDNLIGKDCVIYIDDCLVFSRGSLQDHLERLERVIVRLLSFGLRGKSPKILLAMKELKFLGHMIGVEGRRPCPKKVEAIDNIPIPTGPKAKDMISAFLGMTGFYRSYSEDFEGLAAPLRNLTLARADPERDWTEVHTRCFEAMKTAMKSAPILAYPDFREGFVIKTDASKTRVAGILGQEQDGKFRVVEYLSKKLSSGQRDWHMTHLEGWAVVYCLRKWARYVEGRTGTVVITDHEALVWIRHNRFSDCSGKLIRWVTYIDSFGIEFEHRRGKDHGDVDGLTRVYDGGEDVTWEPEDPALHWMFELLLPHIPSGVGMVYEVNVRGPVGRSVLERSFRYGQLSLSELQDRGQVAGLAEGLVVATPPGRRAILQSLFEGLWGRRCAWAVWAPLDVLQASYFKEPDIQVIVVRDGRRGMYGADSKGRPVKCAWITHGFLDRSVSVRSTGKLKLQRWRKEQEGEVQGIPEVRSVQADWSRWRHNEIFEEGDSDSDVEERWTRGDEWSMGHCALHGADVGGFEQVTAMLTSTAQEGDKERAFAEGDPWCRAAGGQAFLEGGRYERVLRQRDNTIRLAVAEDRRRCITGSQGCRVLGIQEETGKQEHGPGGSKNRFTVPEVVRQEIERVSKQREALVDLRLEPKTGIGPDMMRLVSDRLQADAAQLASGDLQESGGVELMPDTVIRDFQSRDPETQELLGLLRSDGRKGEGDEVRGRPRVLYSEEKGLLLVEDQRGRFNARKRFFVPMALRPHLLHLYHRAKMFCHPGRDRMYETMSQDYFWPNMSRDIGDFVSGCLACQRAKATQPMQEGKSMTVIPEKPFSVIGMDVYGPFPITSSEKEEERGFRYIISIVDYYSRWIKLIPVKEDPTAETVAKVLVYQWVSNFAVPELLATDKDSVFRAQLTQEVGRLLGIRMHVFPAESQWRAGRVERVHRYLGGRLRIWRRDKVRTWHLLIPFIEMSHHFMVMPQYGMSPYEVLYGQRPRLPFTQGEWSSSGYVGAAYGFVRAIHARLRRIQDRFNEIESKAVQERLERINRARKDSPLGPGDQALVFTRGTKDKLTCMWSDLVRIEAKLGSSTFEVRYPNGERERVSAQRLRKFPSAPHRDQDAVGPFLTDFPHFTVEGDAKGKARLESEKLLPEVTIPRPSPRHTEKVTYRKVGEASGGNGRLKLRYGDFVAYVDDSNTWGVGQLLSQEDCGESVCRLRRMGTLHYGSRSRGPREYVWRYHWTAQRGRHVLAKQGKSPGARPSAKNTGRLVPSFVDVEHEQVLGPVHLNGDGTIENDSWTALMNSVRETRPTLESLFTN